MDPFEYNVSQFIYNDKVAVIDLEKEKAFIIQNKEYAEFQKAIFKTLFRKLK